MSNVTYGVTKEAEQFYRKRLKGNYAIDLHSTNYTTLILQLSSSDPSYKLDRKFVSTLILV